MSHLLSVTRLFVQGSPDTELLVEIYLIVMEILVLVFLS